MIRFHDWTIEVADSPIARQFDHLSRRIEVRGDLPEGWDWALLVQVKDAMDIISLLPEEGGAGAVLTADQLSVGDAYYHLQLRGTQGGKVRHTNVAAAYVPGSLSGAGQWPQVPSEFTQVEQRILDANSHPPVPGERGCWMLWNADAGQYEESEFPLPEGVGGGADGGYYVPAVDDSGSLTWTASKESMPAVASVNIKGPAGSDGLTPHVGANGNWWLGDEDTGVSAGGAGGGSSGGGSAGETLVVDFTVTEDVTQIDIPVADMAAAFGSAREIIFEMKFTLPSTDTATTFGKLFAHFLYSWGGDGNIIKEFQCLPYNGAAYISEVRLTGSVLLSKLGADNIDYTAGSAWFKNAGSLHKTFSNVTERNSWTSMLGFRLTGSHAIGAGSVIKIYAKE